MRGIDLIYTSFIISILSGCAVHITTTEPKVDTGTGLMWEGYNDMRLNWSDANLYCKNLSLEEGSDWRLPKIKELQTLIDIKKYDPAAKDGFNVTSNRYWSSTSNISYSDKAWYIYFETGGTFSTDKYDEHYILCVRGRQ